MKVKNFGIVTDVDYLHIKSREIDMRDTNLINFLKDALYKTFLKLNKKAQGISAIQCGYAYRAMLLRFDKDKEPIIIYNPKVILKLGLTVSNEGCLSEGNKRWYVLRPLVVVCSYYDESNNKHLVCYERRKARIFMHEYDHLNGILLQDKFIKKVNGG